MGPEVVSRQGRTQLDAMPLPTDPPPLRGVRLTRPQFVELEAPRSEGAVALYRLWQEVKPPDGLPPRSAFSFERIGKLGLLGQFFVIEPVNGGEDWQYRLVGSQLRWLFGRDATGRPFRQHYDELNAVERINLSNQVARSGKPIFLWARFLYRGRPGEYETMSLPVLSMDRQAVWLVGASFPSNHPQRQADL
ncbi:MAG TPA: PAS domain-containing protein [Kiloniellales bacterium]|nr:PAS domain-containing protein [Kiloniellales bacterium]